MSGTIYVGSHEGSTGDQRVLWVRLAESMYPTVYTLWHNPRLVPLLHTPLVVVEKLQGGADLMIPGVQRGPPFPHKAVKGAIVAIASLEAPTVPMAVGTCAVDVSALGRVQGLKGTAVTTFHWAGDELWAWSATSTPGSEPPDTIAGWDDDGTDNAALADGVAAVDLDSHDEGGSLVEKAPSKPDFIDLVDDKELSTQGKPSFALTQLRLLTMFRN